MTAKQQKFCEEYLKDFNGARAYKVAYPNVKSHVARINASRLLSKANIKAYIKEEKQKLTEKAELTTEWIIKSVKSVAERCMQAEPVLDKEGNATGEFRFEASGANKALELLGRYKGIWIDKLDAKVGLTFEDYILKRYEEKQNKKN